MEKDEILQYCNILAIRPKFAIGGITFRSMDWGNFSMNLNQLKGFLDIFIELPKPLRSNNIEPIK